MYSLGLLALVVVGCLVALQNWRNGLLLCVVVGLLQDPVRKVTPGTPAYLVMAFVPVYVAMFVALLNERAVLRDFFRSYPQSLTIAQLFFVCVAISSIVTLTGMQPVFAILIGLTFYVGWIPAFFLGFYFLRDDYRQLDRALILFGVLTSIMLVGVPLEFLGYKFSEPWLGMVASPGEWRRFYSATDWVAMMSGFYRAPEIMAWHAATLVIISIYMLVRRPAWAMLWVPQAAWGLACVFLGGRRKMFILVLVFVGLFILLSEGRRRGGILFYMLFVSAIIAFFGTMFVDTRYLDTARSTFDTADARVTDSAVTGPLWLFSKVGLFGYGVGTKSQGTQHLVGETTKMETTKTPNVEGGFEKVLVELGIVGTTACLAFGVTMMRLVVVAFRRQWAARGDSTPLSALTAFLLANGMAYLVAFQVYGDPLIGFILGFGLGLVLSASRLTTAQNPIARAPNLQAA